MSAVEEAVAAIAAGGMALVLDAADREAEGDLIMAADAADASSLAFFLAHTSGFICCAITPERADELALPAMTSAQEDPLRTAYLVTVDVADAGTGISAAERAGAARALADPSAGPEALRRPGHLVPLRARPGGVAERPGHTEAAVDLARLAGRAPAGVLCEVVTADKRGMARAPELRRFAARHALPMITIAELSAHLEERLAWARM
ncbi:3,4-dihydroxy-2-butanone-4-phosphate synthase [Naumannella cuiyingiana]|uniref:3,4-dihydroxy-2-butanone 4-phosphate synthase n=1 Tax=Naumannella cuiyingiana TaxID=1347891 RepID=A0A7Z0D7H1_9ACTN|nr:3,4-dihydroxy-2-butanone-4-phosphate synthase [Naumannella cuiyingiana]NYI70171.1 3,4-dihydroxy-2-butanone 4-phosphate synthase [Naumannella cuiyingiana]